MTAFAEDSQKYTSVAMERRNGILDFPWTRLPQPRAPRRSRQGLPIGAPHRHVELCLQSGSFSGPEER